MKKSQFVTKYDYINYYVKQPSMWFFTNSEIQTAYEQQLKKLKLASKEIILDDEDEPVDDEQDVYDVYRELLEQNTTVDEDNPLITSGLIIDKKSKQFIIDYHNSKYGINFKVVDFDDKKINLLACANETKKLIEENPHVILFQPVFIDEKLKIWNENKHRCKSCNKEFTNFNEVEFDHIQPYSKGGKTQVENTQMLCKNCNRSKSNKQ